MLYITRMKTEKDFNEAPDGVYFNPEGLPVEKKNGVWWWGRPETITPGDMQRMGFELRHRLYSLDELDLMLAGEDSPRAQLLYEFKMALSLLDLALLDLRADAPSRQNILGFVRDIRA